MSDVVTNFFTEENKDLGAILLNRTEFRDYLYKINAGSTGTSSGGGGPSGPVFTNTGWSWGLNDNGQLGDGTTINKSVPVQVMNTGLNGGIGANTNLLGFNQIASNRDSFNQFTLAIDSSGQLWGWGNSNGDFWSGDRSSPTVVSTASWSKIAASVGYDTLLLKADGSLWKTPSIKISTGTDWLDIAMGQNAAGGIKADGSLWTWNSSYIDNSTFILGQGIGFHGSTSPVRLGSASNWSKLSLGWTHAAAIDNAGHLKTWGTNRVGQLGIGTVVDQANPVGVGGGNDWASVSCGREYTVAIKTNGSLWTWGVNDYGQLGNNTGSLYLSKSSPVQTIAGGTNWSKVAAGAAHILAIKTDGTLWAWGSNTFGQQGQDSISSKSSPVQIGTDTTWTTITAGWATSLAVKN